MTVGGLTPEERVALANSELGTHGSTLESRGLGVVGVVLPETGLGDKAEPPEFFRGVTTTFNFCSEGGGARGLTEFGDVRPGGRVEGTGGGGPRGLPPVE